MFEEYLQTCGHVKASKIRLDGLPEKAGSARLPPSRDEKVQTATGHLRLGSPRLRLRPVSLDDWERDALAAGVPKDLAGLGRLTVREAYQHGWDDRLKSLCGWYDQGKRMIRLALRSSATAEKRWQQLLDTDGWRGHHDEKTGEWVSHH